MNYGVFESGVEWRLGIHGRVQAWQMEMIVSSRPRRCDAVSFRWSIGEEKTWSTKWVSCFESGFWVRFEILSKILFWVGFLDLKMDSE